MNNAKNSNQIKYAIEMNDITKKFGKITANNKINLKVAEGEVHALVGENGAGKSTLMSVLFGIYNPDSGYIKIHGEESYIKNPSQAHEMGIGMVHQHFKLVGNYTALENIVLGDIPVVSNNLSFLMDLKRAKYKVEKLMEKYKLNINLKTKVEDSNVSTHQKIEILKMLYKNADILIFDEPTAVLNPEEIKGFLEVIKNFKKQGKTIILITHKLKEIEEVADYVTVLRHGKAIKTFRNKSLSIKEVSALMVGRQVTHVKNNSKIKPGQKMLEIKNLLVRKENSRKAALSNLTLDIKSGEILAIAGVEGNGQVALAEAIMGMRKVVKGKITLNNKDITRTSTRNRYESGISYVPEDRHKFGLILNFNIRENTVLQDFYKEPFSNKLGIMNYRYISKHANNIIKKYDVRGVQDEIQEIRELSGGNQQKLIIGREIERKHKLIIFAQPTRGLDVGSIEYIHDEILSEKEKGNAVLLISYELDEVLSLADRVAVINSGSISQIQNIGDINREKIGILMMNKRG